VGSTSHLHTHYTANFNNTLCLSNKKIHMTIMPQTHELKCPTTSFPKIHKYFIKCNVYRVYEENAIFRRAKGKVCLMDSKGKVFFFYFLYLDLIFNISVFIIYSFTLASHFNIVLIYTLPLSIKIPSFVPK
jgi:hypothetical protein